MHTPGPWRAVDRTTREMKLRDLVIEGPDGIELASLYVSDGADDPVWLPIEANARLIAAAPDLLAACRVFVSMFDAPFQDRATTLAAAKQLAEAAIQQAEGPR